MHNTTYKESSEVIDLSELEVIQTIAIFFGPNVFA
jgi:hypothetical protein